MLGVAIAAAVVGFILKAGAALASGWFLVPLAAVACIIHVVVHARAAGGAELPARLATVSNICLLAALLMQREYTPGYNCAEDTLSSVAWRLGLAGEEGCIRVAGWPAIVIDLLLYIPVAVTWQRLLSAPAPRTS
jgi:hypothetical protein